MLSSICDNYEVSVYYFYSMASIRKVLTEYLVRCGALELMGERIKEKIAENPYFQVETVFERLDQFKKGYLVPDDFSQFLLENKIYPSETELYLIFRDFDQERVGVITLQRFLDEIMPKENVKLRTKALDRRYYHGGPRLQIDLQYIVSRYFEHKMKTLKELSRLRLDLHQHANSVEQSWAFLDAKNNGSVKGLNEIDSFLRSNGKVLHKDELLRIFRVLTFDKEGPLLYDTFCQHFDPLGRGYYIGYSQRVAEKQVLQQDFLRQKLELNSQIVRNSRQKLVLSSEISQLQGSNERLTQIIQQQAAQQRLQDEQRRLWMARRHL